MIQSERKTLIQRLFLFYLAMRILRILFQFWFNLCLLYRNTCLSSVTLLYKLFQSVIRYNNKYQWNKSKIQAKTATTMTKGEIKKNKSERFVRSELVIFFFRYFSQKYYEASEKKTQRFLSGIHRGKLFNFICRIDFFSLPFSFI